MMFWLRQEIKENERRTPLTPEDAQALIQKTGSTVHVESSSDRIFKDEDYKNAGCKIVEANSWRKAPEQDFILGLKELPEENNPIVHNHIYFAHIFKGQEGSAEIFSRFQKGGGQLFDLEFLMDENKRRVAAFGRWAGFVGAAVAVDRFYQRKQGQAQASPLHHYENKDLLINEIKAKQDSVQERPRSIIIGAKGRCGSGAREALTLLGLESTDWDYEETKKGGPFQEILEHEIFINTVLMTTKIPPFIDQATLSHGGKLEIISDVSCDPNSELNPIPLYDSLGSWENPFVGVKDCEVEILAVDNLPSVLPKESSEDFSSQLLPHLIDLGSKDYNALPVWKGALDIFEKISKNY